MKICALFLLFSLIAATTGTTYTPSQNLGLIDDSSCAGTTCSSDGVTITFSIEVIVDPEYNPFLKLIHISSVTFLNPLTQRNETIQFKGHNYPDPLSIGQVYCNNSYFNASRNDLKQFVKPFHTGTSIPIYANYENGVSEEMGTQDICGFILVDVVIIVVAVIVGVIGLCCCLGIALQFWACIRKKAMQRGHVRFTNAVNDDPVLIKAV